MRLLRKMVVVRASEVAIGDLEFSYEFNRAYAHFSGVDKLVDQTLQKLRFVRQVGDAAREGVLRDLDSTQKVIISFSATGE